jgi:hypothetical protein
MGDIGPEVPEPEMSRQERKAERHRLRSVRSERRRAKLHGKKDRMNRAKGKDGKKDRKK